MSSKNPRVCNRENEK